MGKTSKKVNASKIKHPNSRKADQFIKQKHKEAARDKKKLASFIKLNSLGEKVLWFRNNLNPEVDAYTPVMVAELIRKYFNRFEEEINIINSRKSYEPLKYASRRDLIKHTQEDETCEYNGCGIMVPDILNELHLKELREWNGELRYLQNLTLVRYNKKQLEKVTMAGDTTSESSLMYSEVVPDAAHPLFLEPTKKDASSSTNSWRYYCQQCNERLINKDAFLNKHFEKKYHEPVTTCKRCKGNVYEYCARQSHALYHKCKKRGECICSQNNNTDQMFPSSDKSNGKDI